MPLVGRQARVEDVEVHEVDVLGRVLVVRGVKKRRVADRGLARRPVEPLAVHDHVAAPLQRDVARQRPGNAIRVRVDRPVGPLPRDAPPPRREGRAAQRARHRREGPRRDVDHAPAAVVRAVPAIRVDPLGLAEARRAPPDLVPHFFCLREDRVEPAPGLRRHVPNRFRLQVGVVLLALQQAPPPEVLEDLLL